MRRLFCLLLALVQVLPSLGAVAPRFRQPLGMTSANHEYLVDTSQPYAEVIQERAWVNNASGTQVGDSLIYRYDIGLDRLHYFKYQMPINGPPSLGSPVLSEWLLFDGLGSTRALVENDGKVADEFGYNDAFGIPYKVTANGGREPAPPGFFLNGQQWDGGSGWGGSIWSGSPAFNSGEGLYFNRARYYQPNFGRFVGEDRWLGDDYQPSTLHRYIYVVNDPANKIDPSGDMMLALFGGTAIGSGLRTGERSKILTIGWAKLKLIIAMASMLAPALSTVIPDVHTEDGENQKRENRIALGQFSYTPEGDINRVPLLLAYAAKRKAFCYYDLSKNVVGVPTSATDEVFITAMIKWADRIFVNLARSWSKELGAYQKINPEDAFTKYGGNKPPFPGSNGDATLWEIWMIRKLGKESVTTMETWYPGMP
jgi:RHS repeat-associated protein